MKLGNAWGSLRGLLRDQLSFAQIKDLVGAAGLPVQALAHLQQKLSGGASKGQLMDGVDGLVVALPPDDQHRFMVACIAEVLGQKPECLPSVEQLLARVGWGVIGTEPYPLRLQIDLETSALTDSIREGIANCLRRYRDGDISGAMTSVCGIVDSLTESVYGQHSFVGHRTDSYQQRISKAFATLENSFRNPLQAAKISSEEIDKLWNNYRGSVNQAGYVLGSFRREFSDAHGVHDAPPELIQRALDCAVFIVRSITGRT